MAITDGKRVSIEYTVKLEDETTVDTNVGKEPVSYTHGGGEILPGLQRALDGMEKGETKTVKLEPEEGYGQPDPEAFREVEKSRVPPDAHKVGTPLVAKDTSGKTHQLRVHEVKNETIVLDLNHPLAGKALIFDVKVVDVS